MSRAGKISFLIFALFAFGSASFADESAARTLSTTGQGVVSAKADMAEIAMQASATHKSAAEAKKAVDQRINAALKAMSEMGISDDDLVASTLQLAPQYDYSNRERTFTGFTANRDLSVTLRKLKDLDRVLEAATNTEISNIQSISLKSSEEDRLRSEARDKAIADSLEKATRLAKAYGAELGAIYRIHYHNSLPMEESRAPAMAMMKAASDAGQGQYIHDEIQFKDQIGVEFELIVPR